jgi:PadR family transcriptional regulator, regulatory protein AphA
MSLEYAILGFLNYLPMSGYDLKKRFDNSIQHFWSADQSQIYQTLARLSERGWTEVEVVAQDGKPNRKVYYITDAGREELHRWLASPILMPETRSAALIQIFFAGQLSDAEILAKFEEAARQVEAALALYRQVPQVIAQYAAEIGTPRDAFCWGLTLEMGLVSTRAQLDWIYSVIERMKAGRWVNWGLERGEQ